MDNVLLYCIFVLAAFAAALEPGPSFIKLTTQTVTNGKIDGFLAAFGMFSGAIPYIILIATGLGWIFDTIPMLLTILKVLGGIYLLWLAFDLLRKPNTHHGSAIAGDAVLPSKHVIMANWRSFFGGFALVILNPRTIVFYSTFLPLFLITDLSLSISTQLLLLGFTVSSIFFGDGFDFCFDCTSV